jgi:3-hydroxybutyryl-CoA dehydrogenase
LTGESIKEIDEVREKIAIAGSGAIACGLAATVAAHYGDVFVLVRSDEAAERASKRVDKLLERMDAVHGDVRVVKDFGELGGATIAVEAIVEALEPKGALLAELHDCLPDTAILATTTSSLPIAELAEASGRPGRFAGFHVFNPVPKMELVEVIYPDGVDGDVPERMRNLCRDLAKTCVEVPDTRGFIVNRLLFPYLFDAVRVMEETGLAPEAIDRCMTLGTGHPMGPLALLDYIGLDVACAIGQEIRAEIPGPVTALIEDGALGKKSGRGFYEY